ncbi:hypothetical protein GGR56DRAFT_69040 [Xylariaceae sp. FL0804]|nr:hypothetical protein GGR56DRAFT_69040 [Xylariaceae sp. FL0804]
MPSARPFSSASQVYPSYLPALHRSGRMEKRIATAVLATGGICYGALYYTQKQGQYQQRSQLHHASAYSGAASDARKTPEQLRQDAMDDAYGGRDSLAELEAAVQAYEKKHSSNTSNKQ